MNLIEKLYMDTHVALASDNGVGGGKIMILPNITAAFAVFLKVTKRINNHVY